MASGELVYGYSAEIAQWVAERIPHVRRFDTCEAIGVVSCGRLIAGVVYHDYQRDFGTIQLSMAADSPMWARRETIAALLAYPFYQLGCFKVWVAIPIDNEMAIKVNRHVGLTREAILAHQFGWKRHAVVMRMFRPTYQRLYGEVYGQECRRSARRA